VTAAFVRDHNVLYIAATAIEYMIYLKICAFLFFRHERGRPLILRYGSVRFWR